MYHETRTSAEAYRLAGIPPLEDELGLVRIVPFDFAQGLTLFVEGMEGKRYSLSSHIPTLTMTAIRNGDPKWPKRLENEMVVTEKEKIVILGGHPNWSKLRNISDNAATISLYQSGPSEVMEGILYGFHMSKNSEAVVRKVEFPTKIEPPAQEEPAERYQRLRKIPSPTHRSLAKMNF